MNVTTGREAKYDSITRARGESSQRGSGALPATFGPGGKVLTGEEWTIRRFFAKLKNAFSHGAPNSGAVKQAVRAAVEGVDSNLPVYGIRTMHEVMANSLERRRFALTLMALFGALALFLASIGIYGVMAYAIGQRSQEFGLRMALGAAPHDILLRAFRPGVVLTCFGIAVGLLWALGSARLMSSLLYGIAPYDPVTFGAVVAVLALVALAACGIPARRAIRIAPATALRA